MIFIFMYFCVFICPLSHPISFKFVKHEKTYIDLCYECFLVQVVPFGESFSKERFTFYLCRFLRSKTFCFLLINDKTIKEE